MTTKNNPPSFPNIAAMLRQLQISSGDEWADIMGDLDEAIAQAAGVRLQTSHGIRKLRRGKDKSINLPATMATSEYYQIYEVWDGSVRLVPVKTEVI
jgi:hypothetical protein